MTEQDYLEMANQFKEVYEKLELKLKEKERIIIELKKKVFFNYTFSRLIDNYIGSLDIDGIASNDLKTLIEIQRGQNSMDIDAILGVNNDIDNVD